MRRGSIWDTIGEAVRPGTSTGRVVSFLFVPVLAVLVLLLPPFSVVARISGGGGNGGGQIVLGTAGGKGSIDGLTLEIRANVLDSDVTVKIQKEPKGSKVQALPQEISPASSPYRVSLNKLADVPISVEVALDEQARPGDTLDFFALEDNSWEWVAGATLSEDGRVATANLRKPPSLLVVGRLASQQPILAGWLPPNGSIDTVARENMAIVSPLWHTAKDDGSLAGPMSELPKGQFKVFPTIHNLVDGSFKGDTINRILRSDDVRKQHIDKIVGLAKQNQYAGVDINYQQIDPILRDKFTAFIVDLASSLHQEKRYLSLLLPLPEKNARGWETGAYDWYSLGKAADYVTISATTDQAAYTSLMPEVLSYATTQVDRRKLRLMVSTLSHEQSKAGIKDMALSEALDLAAKVDIKGSPSFVPGETVTFYTPNLLKDTGASGMYWNKDTKTVAFSYAASDGQRTVWIENSFSVAYKLQYVKQFDLGGATIQNLGDTPADKTISSVLQAFKTDGSIQLTEPGGQAFSIAWQSSDGSLSSSGTSWVNWTIPNNPGAKYTVGVIVGDGVGTTTVSKTLVVAIPPTPTSTPTPKPTSTPRPPTATPGPNQPVAVAPTPTPVRVAPPPGGVKYPGVGYGMQVDQGNNLPKALQMLRGAGFSWAKVQIRWNAVEGSKGNINWGYLDGIVNQMQANGVRVMFSIVAAPSWSTPADYTEAGPPANPQDYADFVSAIARRYTGKVHAYEVWNEQNVFYEWGGRGRRLNAGKYVELLKAAYTAVKAADADAVVVSGGLTPTGVNDGDIAYDDVVYMDMMYQAGLKDYSDAIGVHGNVIYPYGPEVPIGTNGGHGSFFFRRFEELRAIMEKYGDTGKQIWLTEFGWPSSPIPLANYQFANQISEAQQAEWLVKAFDIARERGYVGVMFLWNLNFAPGAEPDDIVAKAAFSVLRRDWSPRPSYNALAAMPK